VRRVLLVVVLLVSFVGLSATPAAAPTWCPTSMTGYPVSFSSYANGQFVTAEISAQGNGYGQLRARTAPNDTGPWEVFRLVCVQGPDIYAIRSEASGKYVTTEMNFPGDDKGLLRARVTAIGAWEKYRIPNSAAPTIYSLAAQRYVTTEVGRTGSGYAALRARATVVGLWEYYTLW
jgi:hypothetical protein